MPESWTKDVFSSNVRSVGYDPETQDLIVTFKTGSSYIYSGVPEELAVSLAMAPSVGQMLNSEIKPNYGFRRA